MSGIRGACLCGAVTYGGAGAFQGVELCHCAQCRVHGAGPFMSGRFEDGLTIQGEALKWFASSKWAERGFCSACGTSLFWRMQGETSAAVNAHTLSDPAALSIHEHIFIDSKPDWYDFSDAMPRLTAAECIARHEASES